MKTARSIFFLGLAALVLFTSCQPGTMRGLADRRDFLFGVAVASTDLLDPTASKILQENFNLLVAENIMKLQYLRPSPTLWNWRPVDDLVNFAKEHRMKLRGHTFLWHNQNPPFINRLGRNDRDRAITILEETITGVLTRYKGVFYEYDVCNEVIDDEGRFRENSPWYRAIGPEYIDMAFHTARKADPNVKLILNDYNNEYKGTIKGDAFYTLVKGMVERGVPIDGVGFQLHLMAEHPLNEEALRANIQRFRELGLSVSFTEVDVRIKLPVTPEKEAAQKAIYESLLRIALEEDVSCFVMWGYTDANSWIPGSFPGYGSAHIFDEKLTPKPVYFAMQEILKSYHPDRN
ncbi:endo-1,4-beta-xylanase [Spirochaeta thermophila]|uniref:Beta-xylanase n=1 Tax=Winmispira thermophila (strain ATCC 49972 / DSM 6192 / RI 19.B1) TaxID=665571 RepID=E0RPX5_WINT6|nr:endo-1,4-beta-xylanase [Spirochaeta thermophila]ADN02828.1 endo-1,4-beta-xylanase B precursor [Spirochaeta thermophila DSM 6192]